MERGRHYLFDMTRVEKWISTAKPEDVDAMLWRLRMHAHYNCEGFSDYTGQHVKVTKGEREKELRAARKKGKELAKEGRLNRMAVLEAAEILGMERQVA